MAIKQSVGKDGHNEPVDVKVIQAALNLSQTDQFQLQHKLDVDGIGGKNTVAAVEAFQAQIVGMQSPDGRVDPGGRTLQKLHSVLSRGLSEDAFLAVMAYGSVNRVASYFPLFDSALPNYQIDTPLRIAHFLAQVGHESLSLHYTSEIASGAAYEGRKDLGNTQPGDGERFKGRGLIQITGRNNYKEYSEYSGVDFLKAGNETLIATDPKYSLDVSLWFWQSRELNTLADQDDLRAITRRVNGGYNGLEDRRAYLQRAKFFLVA